MRRTTTAFAITLATLGLALSVSAQTPPAAPIHNVVDEYWGVKVQDPYRYMENLKDSTVQTWIKGQADYTTSVLERIPGRDSLMARIKALDAGRPYSIYGIHRMVDGRLFYYRQAVDENVGKLYVRASLKGEEHLLIDPTTKAPPGGGHYSIGFYEPSPDGRYIAYGMAASGSEQEILYVLDVASGKNLPDSIDRFENAYTDPQWLPDGSGFFYSRRRQLPPEAPPTEGYKQTRAFLHRLGTNPDQDPAIFAMNLWPGVDMTEEDFPGIVLPSGSNFVIGQIKHGDANQLTLYAAPLSTIATSNTPWKKLCDVSDSVNGFTVEGDQAYLLTSRGAPRFRLVRTSLENPDFATAEEVIPAGSFVITGASAAKDALYISTLDGGARQVIRFGYKDGTPTRLQFPGNATSGGIVAVDETLDGIFLTTTSWTERSGTWAYDPATNSFTDTGLNPEGTFDKVTGYESKEIMAPSYDGVMVPLSIMYKTGIKLDGSNPTLLSGYGSYGMSTSAFYDPQRLAWLERGCILAVAHVRGGGEFGQEWHLGGQKRTKQNTWKDFIACAEYLIKEGYTSPAKLAGQGGSAGGILIGRAITERPDLFAAALIDVGSLDAIRMETTTNGVPNIQEFGTVKKEDEFHALLEMSSYHHVEDGKKYPAVMLSCGMNDPRVEPWESAKMCARLQAASSSGKPILLRVDYKAGHGIGSTKAQYQSSLADKWAFLLWQMGEPGFQPHI
jgi:prolyl oligopeptidase